MTEFGGAARGVDDERPLMVRREVDAMAPTAGCGGAAETVAEWTTPMVVEGRHLWLAGEASVALGGGRGGREWRSRRREYAWSAAGGRCGVRTHTGSQCGARDEGGRVAARRGWPVGEPVQWYPCADRGLDCGGAMVY
uniref:Uncharacterized protein n=1 Tax=Oryza meridionalis TaxID=40149 RepID=A0A0E0DS81_9ORYZ